MLTGILTGEARQALGRQIEADTIEQMEPIKFTPPATFVAASYI